MYRENFDLEVEKTVKGLLLRTNKLSKATIMLLLGSILFLSGCNNDSGG
ncbi:MAG: hypothetical protein GXO11_07650, partial [Epsilonproteobacteria bacterium]|nr:hypothetical protein [Campylobacterota bacterium]